MDQPIDWTVKKISGPEVSRSKEAESDDWSYKVILVNSNKDLHEIFVAVPSLTVKRLLRSKSEDESEQVKACKQLISAFCYDQMQYEWKVESSFDLRITRRQCIRLLKR
jgi:hypothetical protein